ncbi:EAL domain-containing protein [Vibrio tubiashii]|uniref:EAL domain-containing protein n=1 Tax=Vibrio tubiashii TaxID=29498 RepID=UPI001EFDF417|nr:EAL domain-containing protein [Vibrio tubiashii]MCG9576671.1 EAL domain-containing protein [Vibrio tubiashii]
MTNKQCAACDEILSGSDEAVWIDRHLCGSCAPLFGTLISDGFPKDQFVVMYQPKYQVTSKRITAVEALVRWEHPQLGLLTPDKFLKELIQLGFSFDLFDAVYMTAMKDVVNWNDNGKRLDISINVNVSDIVDRRFDQAVELLDELADKYSSTVTFELTELQEHDEELRERIHSILSFRTIKMSIDDYGMGHSSLARLLQSEFTEIKLDRAFIQEMCCNERYYLAIQHVITLAKKLGMTVVAEGVETLKQESKLILLGCDYLQGFHIGRPMRASQIDDLLEPLCDSQMSKAL